MDLAAAASVVAEPAAVGKSKKYLVDIKPFLVCRERLFFAQKNRLKNFEPALFYFY